MGQTSKSEPEGNRFARTRAAHRAETAEDYVETILDLIDEDGSARLTELAQRFGVAHPTASKALKRLQSEGFVVLAPYRSITLTPKGHALALLCRERHQLVVRFLLAIGLDRASAEADAEGIEHHVSEATFEAMRSFCARSPGTTPPL